ncbi:GPI inositol deacylase [Geranomyces michiganensis]|nr:GPI inositol deacylase [Geranomyces michiganensis]
MAFFIFASWSLLVASIWSFYTRGKDPLGCEMTYMWPEYIREEAFRPTDKYSLYLYKEADGLERERDPTGTPVLFIPGNAGSYKQARSLGSVLTHEYRRLVKADSEAKHAPFDVFTVDTNEELSAFQRTLIEDQASYVNAAIQYILKLYTTLDSYERTPRPSAVIIIAHSMGGVVARTLPVMPNYIPGSVNTIITMATPHLAPPAPLEARLARLYQKINTLWRTSLEVKTADALKLHDITLISLAGGTHDTMVSSSLVEISPFIPPMNGFTAYTSGAPLVWTAADHRAILWCNQVVKAVARALFGIIDGTQSARTVGRERRLDVFRAEFAAGNFEHNERGDLGLAGKKEHQVYLVSNLHVPPTIRVCNRPPPSHQARVRCRADFARAAFKIPSLGEGKMTISGITIDLRTVDDTTDVIVDTLRVELAEFVLAGIVHEANTVVDIGAEQFDLRSRLYTKVLIKSAVTVVNILSITTGPFKYTVRWRQQYPSKALFTPVLHQSFASSSESKTLLNPHGSLLTTYAQWDGDEDAGLVLRVVADPAGGDLDIEFEIAWVESLGAVLGRYMMGLVAFGLAVGVQAVAETVDVKAGGKGALGENVIRRGPIMLTAFWALI